MSYEKGASVAAATLEKPQPSAQRFHCVLRYAIDGDLRYISHHDTVRLFQRAIARANLPVKHSEGFNPHARIQFPLPRSVGVASDAEYVLMEFAEKVDSADVLARLAPVLPQGLTLKGARELLPGERLQPGQVRYRLSLADENREELSVRVAAVAAAESLPVVRANPKKNMKKTIDVRPYLADVSLVGGAVELTLRVTHNGTARPAEIAELLGISAGSINHRIRRMEIQWL